MSITTIRDAFIKAAGNRLSLTSLTMSYDKDGKAQVLHANGTTADGAWFDVTTEPFLGDVTVIQQRAAQLADEIVDPSQRQRGTQLNLTAHGEHAEQPQSVAAPAAPAKPHAKPTHVSHRR